MTEKRYHHLFISYISLLASTLLFLTACGGTFEVDIEYTAVPEQTATVTTPSDLATSIPTVTPPPDLATCVPTVTPPPAQPTASHTSTSPPDPSSDPSGEHEGGILGSAWNLADLRYGLHPDRVQIVWEMAEPGDHVPEFQVVEVSNAASPFPTGHDPSWGEARIDLVVSDLYA